MLLTARQRRRQRAATQLRMQREHERGSRHRNGDCPMMKRCFGPLVWYKYDDIGFYWADNAANPPVKVYYTPLWSDLARKHGHG